MHCLQILLLVEYEGLNTVNLSFDSRISNQIGFGIHGSSGRNIAVFARLKGKEKSLSAYLDLKPIDRLVISPSFNFAQSNAVSNDALLFKQFITRTNFQLQANKELSIRLIVQHDDFSKTWQLDPLLTYRLIPFSMFYIGSTYDYQEYQNMTTQLQPDNRFWKLKSRQFFMKIQYLFQV